MRSRTLGFDEKIQRLIVAPSAIMGIEEYGKGGSKGWTGLTYQAYNRDFNLMKKIHIPIMRGSLLTCLLLVFVDVLKELPATLILRPFNFNTLAVRTFELANEERLAEAAVPALAIVIAGIIPVIIISNSISRSRPGYE